MLAHDQMHNFYSRLFIVVSLFSSFSARGEAFSMPEISVIRSSSEQLGVGPGGIVMADERNLAALDIVRQKLILIDTSNGSYRSFQIPNDYGAASSIRIVGKNLQLLSDEGVYVLEADLVSLPKKEAFSWKHDNEQSTQRLAIERKFVAAGEISIRRNENSGLTISGEFNGENRRIGLSPLEGGVVTSVNDLRILEDGSSLAWWEETASTEDKIDASAWTGRFSPSGQLLALARVPIETVDEIPLQYVALSPNGKVYFQGLVDGRVLVEDIQLLTPSEALKKKRAESRGLIIEKNLGNLYEKEVRRVAEEELGNDGRAAIVFPRKSREEIINEARRYLNMKWLLPSGAYSKDGMQSFCEPASNKFWLRPNHLSGRIGQTLTSMPYRWGGTSTPESFTKWLNKGRIAGDVCTCRDSKKNYCIVPEAIGVDCSGLISNVWGVQRYTTSSLKLASVQLKDIRDLLPGDALNKEGSHVRLFVGFEVGDELKYVTIESAVSCGGVCERRYTSAQLRGYKSIRYKAVY